MTIHFDIGNPFITILVFLECNACICNCGDFRGRNGSCLNIYVHKSHEIYACTHLFCSGVVIFPNFNGHVIDLPVFFRVASLAMWQSCHFRRATYIKSSGNRYEITSTEQALFAVRGSSVIDRLSLSKSMSRKKGYTGMTVSILFRQFCVNIMRLIAQFEQFLFLLPHKTSNCCTLLQWYPMQIAFYICNICCNTMTR